MPQRPWIVTRHDPIEELDDNLWAVEGDVPGFPLGCGMNRRMCIIKLTGGSLAFYNAIPLDEDAMAKVRAWGKPSILIAPVWVHTTDAHAFQEKLGLTTYASPVMIDKVRAQVPGAKPLEELPDELEFEMLSGTKFGEPVFLVKAGPRVSLIFCDAFQNSRPGFGMGGFMFRLMGFTGNEPKTPPFYKWRAASDKSAIKEDLLRLADTPGLVRLVPSHGLVVSQDPAEALRAAAKKYL